MSRNTNLARSPPPLSPVVPFSADLFINTRAPSSPWRHPRFLAPSRHATPPPHPLRAFRSLGLYSTKRTRFRGERVHREVEIYARNPLSWKLRSGSYTPGARTGGALAIVTYVLQVANRSGYLRLVRVRRRVYGLRCWG
jgi:hypothetical protein